MAACVLLSELEGRGHSCLLLANLNADPAALLGWSGDEWRDLRASVGGWPEDVAQWRDLLAACPQVWPVGGDNLNQPLVLDGDRLYLRRYWQDETCGRRGAQPRAGRRAGGRCRAETADIRRWLDILFPHAARGGGTDWQKSPARWPCVASWASSPAARARARPTRWRACWLCCLPRRAAPGPAGGAGGADRQGGGAAQAVDRYALDELAEKVGSALPLRELAARMGAARTLHSLLGARPDTRAFQHHAGNQLDVDVLIVDEASMIHLEMMSALLAALPPEATLILLGDKDQLASVEAGAVLGDLCHNAEAGDICRKPCHMCMPVPAADSRAVCRAGGPIAQQTVMLRESRRFGGPIGALALAVNAGDAGKAWKYCVRARWQSCLDRLAQPSDLLQLALSGYRPYLQLIKNMPENADDIVRLGILKSFESFRLCAVREGEWGVSGLNDAIEQRLQRLDCSSARRMVCRPAGHGHPQRLCDRGVQRRYRPDLARPGAAGALRVYFSEGETVRSVLATRLRNVETAFAMTVHKSQGSEFAHTAMVLPKDSGGMLARELIYTGITRARDYFTLLTPNGQVLLDAIGQRTQRASGLRHLLGS
jgi:exodeoxyribonuclease V alpha subunit